MVLNDRYSRRRVAIMAIILLVSLRPSRTFGQRPIVQAAANNNKKAAVEWFGLGGVAAAEAVQTDEYIQGLYYAWLVWAGRGLSCLVCASPGRMRSLTFASFSLSEELIVIDDHVAPVHGLESVDLAFDGIEMTLEGKKGQKRKLLDGSIRGRARPGRMLAIMGPSGAGKSTLLHALAGRIRDQKKLSLQGRRFLNGEPISGDSVLPIAFVEQEVTFFPHMTVRETLQFRVELKLGNKLKSQRARDARVEELLDLVGLQKAADTIVGNAKVRGISGGERKRLSIAVEMITSPSCIFLDEPTSGLDSTAATSLVRLLRKLADQGKTVVAVIHQPSQHVFNQFDDLLLVSEGRQLYFGEVSNVRSYMEAHGCHAPREMGTSEHVLDCITKLPVNGESTVEDSQRRLDRLADLATAKPLNLGLKSRGGGGTPTKHFVPVAQHAPNANMLRQFQLLLRRSFREIKRAKATLIIKAVQQVTLGLVYGGIYSLGNDQASIQDRFGLLSLIAIGASNVS
jgi:ABC-type multidrug transport system ATPase subunit